MIAKVFALLIAPASAVGLPRVTPAFSLAESTTTTAANTAASFGNNNDVEECSGTNCAGYRGYQNVTVNGKTCQAWASQEPHIHKVTREANP